MKKIGKLTINPEKLIRNEELVNLRGGYGGNGVYCGNQDGTGFTLCIAPGADPSEECGDTFYVISFSSPDCGY